MKIKVCDICFKQDKKLTEAKYRTAIKGLRDTAIDLCDEHKTTPPKPSNEYIRFVYKLDGFDLSDETISGMLNRR